jgi:peptidoglycan/LPS O-acetylase OafA/YrhL
MENNYRIFGLDLYRSAAIILLLLANILNSFQIANPTIAQFAPILGFLSLEIFFVLCGFLLGNSFYRLFIDENFSTADAIRFIKRKMLRIVPLYLLVLAINIAIAYVMDYPIGNVWAFFFFLQNFAKPIPMFFPESWGLPVIVFGILMFVGLMTALSRIIRKQHKPMAFLLATIGLIAVFLWTKWLYHTQNGATDATQWDSLLKTVAIYRFDSVYIGVLFSWLFIQKRVLWEKTRFLFAFLGFNGIIFLAFGIAIFQLEIESHAAFWNIFYLPLTSMILGCFLPLFASWQTAPAFLQKIFSSLGQTAYAIYLVHFSIVLLLAEHFMKIDFLNNDALLLMNAVYFSFSVLLGWALHNGLEKRIKSYLG